MKEQETLWIFFLCILIRFVQGKSECHATNGCTCFTSNEFKYQCPPGNFKIVLHTIPQRYVKINCYNLPEYDLSIFPDVNVGDVDYFEMRSCPLPDNGFGSTLEKLNISNIKYMKLEEISNTTVKTVTKELFNGLSTLERLSISLFRIKFEDKCSFTGLHQLKTLELSNNKISSLYEDTFAELIELVNISLRSNYLSDVTSKIFKYNTALEGVDIGNNPSLNLSDYVFANLTNLTNVNINSSKLESLPEHLFEGSFNILDISLKNNSIRELPGNIFQDLSKLTKLNLARNKIAVLPNIIFSSLKNLKELYLEGNRLTEIKEELFTNTFSLNILNLRSNKIATIHRQSFQELRTLTKLDLSYNQYNLKDENNPFNQCEELRELNLSHNAIDNFPKYIIQDKKYNLIYLDLDDNHIEKLEILSLEKLSTYGFKVYLNNNNISILDFEAIKECAKWNSKRNNPTVLYMSNNPIRCDCDNYDFIQYNNDKLDPVVRTLVDIKLDNLYCSTPQRLAHVLVKDLKRNHVMCPLEGKGCPKQCTCNFRPYDHFAVMNCSYRNLTNTPMIYVTDKRVTQIEVNLEGNELQTGPYKGLGYESVTRLYLSNNRIKNLSWIPPKINELRLNGNQLSFIDYNVLHSLNESTLQNVTLYDNPWSCSCSSVDLQHFLIINNQKVNRNDVKCDDNKLLIDRKELCKSNLTIVITIATPILLVLFATAVAVALYLYYRQEIKVWLYAKNLCLWFVTEEELDKDKTYDIFISYSHKDEEFVIQDLLPVLETGPNPFKICIHVRDWIPGEFIDTQIVNSVLDSKRTLVILSESFLESVWGKMEFRAAHTQAINEGRARVVVVKYGPLNEEKLDRELKTYLKTNTYVEWGDPWFWNKLKYALPHSKKLKYYANNQKHANIMLKIDGKFELVTFSPTATVQPTPPVKYLDPLLLKDHPLHYKSATNITSSLAEAPLIID